MPHNFPRMANETIGKETGHYCPIFHNIYARSAAKHFTAHRPEETVCLWLWSIHCSLFHYLYFPLDDFSICVNDRTGIVQISCVILSINSKTKACAEKILTALSSTAFVHRCRYDQNKIKYSSQGLSNRLQSSSSTRLSHQIKFWNRV